MLFTSYLRLIAYRIRAVLHNPIDISVTLDEQLCNLHVTVLGTNIQWRRFIPVKHSAFLVDQAEVVVRSCVQPNPFES